MAKKAKAAANGAPEAGTATSVETNPKTKTKVAVEVHPKLLELYKQEEAATEKAASILVEIGELVARENISNPVLVKTMMKARGIEESSAKSQVSRFRSLMKDKDSWEALKEGRATVRAAVKSAQARRIPSKASTSKKFDAAVNNLIVCAKATGQDKKTILTTIEAALEKGGIK